MTLASRFAASVRRHADRDFLHVPGAAARDYAPSAVTLSYAQSALRVEALRRRYAAAGYGPGHRVAVALDNRPDFFLHLLALNGQGASVVPLNGALRRDELNFVLAHSDAALVVAHAGHAARLGAALPDRCALDICGHDRPLAAPARGPAAAHAEVALIYTSGTSGAQKGCILDETYFECMGSHYAGIGGYCALRTGEERLITPLPVTHMNALAASFLAMLFTGGCLVQLDRFHSSSWWDSVRDSGATCFHYLGVMPAMLLAASPAPCDHLGGRVRFGFGAGVDPRHHAQFEARFGVPLVEAWAMTETGGGAWITASHEPRHVGQRCFGRPPHGLEWRVVTGDGDAAPQEPGELLVRRAGAEPRRGFFAGYYRDAPATEAAWSDGWFHTGDIVRVGADGSFFFVDRSKNIIRRSGENIAAVEVESIVLQTPGVAACAVAAVPDELRGEEVFALVAAAPGHAADRALALEIQAAALARLAYYKAPGYVAFIEALPQTASQKLARGEVKRLAAALSGSGAAFDLRHGKRRPAGRE